MLCLKVVFALNMGVFSVLSMGSIVNLKCFNREGFFRRGPIVETEMWVCEMFGRFTMIKKVGRLACKGLACHLSTDCAS